MAQAKPGQGAKQAPDGEGGGGGDPGGAPADADQGAADDGGGVQDLGEGHAVDVAAGAGDQGAHLVVGAKQHAQAHDAERQHGLAPGWAQHHADDLGGQRDEHHAGRQEHERGGKQRAHEGAAKLGAVLLQASERREQDGANDAAESGGGEADELVGALVEAQRRLAELAADDDVVALGGDDAGDGLHGLAAAKAQELAEGGEGEAQAQAAAVLAQQQAGGQRGLEQVAIDQRPGAEAGEGQGDGERGARAVAQGIRQGEGAEVQRALA